MRAYHFLLVTLSLLALLQRPACAQQTAAEPLGRLFVTQAERLRMDQARQLGATRLDLVDLGTTLNGYVIRNNGKTTTWINQVPIHENESRQELRVVQQPQHDPVILVRTDDGKRVKLRVGDSVEKQTGQVHKLLDMTKIQPSVTRNTP